MREQISSQSFCCCFLLVGSFLSLFPLFFPFFLSRIKASWSEMIWEKKKLLFFDRRPLNSSFILLTRANVKTMKRIDRSTIIIFPLAPSLNVFPPIFSPFREKAMHRDYLCESSWHNKFNFHFRGDLLLFSRVSRKDSFFWITREMDVYVPFATPKFSCFLVLGKRRRILFLHEKRSLCKYGLKRCREKGNKDSFSLSSLSLTPRH